MLVKRPSKRAREGEGSGGVVQDSGLLERPVVYMILNTEHPIVLVHDIFERGFVCSCCSHIVVRT
jgi:hypothetical protein